MTDWEPLFEGDEALEILAAVEALAGELADPDCVHRSDLVEALEMHWQRALFLAYAGHSLRRDDWIEACYDELDRAVAAFGDSDQYPLFFGGFAGLGWATEHIEKTLLGTRAPDDEDPNADIDDALTAILEQPDWIGPFDLVSGLVGFGVYALERMPSPAATALAEQVLRHLLSRAETDDAGTRWPTPKRHMTAWQLELAPGGKYDLGLVHGTPGIIAWLSQAAHLGVGGERARAVLESSVDWLLAQQHTGQRGRFPSWVGVGVGPHFARNAWCYGDPGVAASICLAAEVLDRADWRAAAGEIALGTARGSPEAALATNAFLCHGTAGNAHIFNRLFHGTSMGQLRDCARDWYRAALGSRSEGDRFAGFATALSQTPGGEPSNDSSLLVGASGLGLALLAAVSDRPPGWDRALLLSFP